MKNVLRIIYMGTPDFAVAPLKKLLDAEKNVVAVITTADKPAGRGQKLAQSAVKVFAESKGLKVLQPINLKSADFQNDLKSLKADIQIVVAFRMLPEPVWNMPPLGTFNLHASLLPKYRGAAPINWAIINGEKETGVSTFFLKHEIDTGAVIYQEKTKIKPNETAGELHDRLMVIGADLVLKTVESVEENKIKTIEQSEIIKEIDKIPEAPKIFKEDCLINWSKDLRSTHNFIRGLSPYPTAWTKLKHKNNKKEINLKIFNSNIEKVEQSKNSGTLFIEDKKIKIAFTEGNLLI